MKRITTLLILGAAAGVAALTLAATDGSSPEDTSAGEHRVPERGSELDPRLEGHPRRTPNPSPASPEAEDADPQHVDLDTLYTEYTPGEPGEWPLLKQIESGLKSRPDWWESVVGGMGIHYRMPVPPFLSDVVFGDPDRPWLERVKASFDAEFRRRTQDLAENTDEYVWAYDRLVRNYSGLLSEVAAKRAADSPEVAGLFSDTTQLRDMKTESHRARWLESMIGVVGHREMWADPDLVHEEDAQYLCAADLRYLKGMSMALQSIVRGMTTEQRLDPGTRALVRREVEGLARLIASRK